MKASIFYSGLKESEEVKGWDKQTVKYAIEKEETVRKNIASIAKNVYGKSLQLTDIDDIYMDTLQYFYDCADYSLEKAMDKSSSGVPVSLEGYICACIKYCVLRHISKESKDIKTVPESIQNGDEEVSIFNLIESNDEVSDGMSLEELLHIYECKRYCTSEDMYEVWFVGLVTLREHKEDKYNDIMEVLGIKGKGIENISDEEAQEAVYQIAKAITGTDLDKAINAFKTYVYGCDTLENTIVNM